MQEQKVQVMLETLYRFRDSLFYKFPVIVPFFRRRQERPAFEAPQRVLKETKQRWAVFGALFLSCLFILLFVGAASRLYLCSRWLREGTTGRAPGEVNRSRDVLRGESSPASLNKDPGYLSDFEDAGDGGRTSDLDTENPALNVSDLNNQDFEIFQSKHLDSEISQIECLDFEIPESKPLDVEIPKLKSFDVEIPEFKPLDVEVSELKPLDVEVSELKSSEFENSELKPLDAEVPESKPLDVEVLQLKSQDLEIRRRELYDVRDQDVKDPALNALGAGKKSTFGAVASTPSEESSSRQRSQPVLTRESSRTKHGFVVICGNSYTLAVGTFAEHSVVFHKNVKLMNRHCRGGQSQNRFQRLADESRHMYVNVVVEAMTEHFLGQDGQPLVEMILLAGPGPMKNLLQNRLVPPFAAMLSGTLKTKQGGEKGLAEITKKFVEATRVTTAAEKRRQAKGGGGGGGGKKQFVGNGRSNNFDLSPSAYDDLYYYDYDYSDEDSYCHLDYRDDTAAYEDYIEDCYDYD